MQQVIRVARRVATSSIPVLLLGETGSGKELFARWIHQHSGRADQPFVGVNLAAIPADLIESTLFGHEKGAFTGAHGRLDGKFSLAGQGTLLLDEVAELRIDLQAKLLRVLQEGEYERVGGTQTQRCHARIIAATNRDVRAAVARGEFREDLYFRLNAVTIALPALRERREDIPELVRFFLAKFNAQYGTHVNEVSEGALAALQQYHWPGNIRELENAVQRAVNLADGDTATEADFFDQEQIDLDDMVRSTAAESGSLAEMERRYIEEILRCTGGHQGRAVEILGIDRKTLYNKILKYGLGSALRVKNSA
jgi:DNA-binding NtrC family response regulator